MCMMQIRDHLLVFLNVNLHSQEPFLTQFSAYKEVRISYLSQGAVCRSA